MICFIGSTEGFRLLSSIRFKNKRYTQSVPV